MADIDRTTCTTTSTTAINTPVERLAVGFSEAKVERRRPSKRTTTLRAFTVVRNWESKQVSPPVPQTPIKEDSNEQLLATSPVYPRPSPSRYSLEVPNISTTENCKDADNPVTETKVDNLSSDLTEENTDHSATNASAATSALTDENLSLSVESATPENQVQVTQQVPSASSPDKKLSDNQNTSTTFLATSVEEKTPKVTRGRKRKQVGSEEVIQENDDGIGGDDDDDNEDHVQYSANKFVRIFNADQGRKLTMAEITDLDVVLTAIEEVALEYREEVESDIAKQCIKEFFIQVRKSFGECIDMQKDCKSLKSDYRKANSKLKKLRGELLEVQKKRTRIKGGLEKMTQEELEKEKEERDLLEISEYLYQMENIQKKCSKMIPKESTLRDTSLSSNLPSLLSQTQGLLTSVTRVMSINNSLEEWLTGGSVN